jgi:hypothetical protein
MPVGPGKYDAECTKALLDTNAACTVLIVLGGNRGNGFSVTSRVPVTDDSLGLARMLREMADQVDGVS